MRMRRRVSVRGKNRKALLDKHTNTQVQEEEEGEEEGEQEEEEGTPARCLPPEAL